MIAILYGILRDKFWIVMGKHNILSSAYCRSLKFEFRLMDISLT
jgi:hypothetical protein